jgi:hypothetical protein
VQDLLKRTPQLRPDWAKAIIAASERRGIPLPIAQNSPTLQQILGAIAETVQPASAQ